MDDIGYRLKHYEPSYLEPEINMEYNEEKEEGCKKLIIFNMIDFKNNKLKSRDGSKIDGDLIMETFTRMGFNCEQYIDPDKDDVFDIIDGENSTNESPEKFSCFAIVILTHGENGFLHAFSEMIEEEEIFDRLSEKNANVKLCIIQACRIEKDEKCSKNIFSFTSNNMIVFHSQYSFKEAYRLPYLGTPFIQILCKRLSIMQEKNSLIDEFTFVTKDVAYVTCGCQIPVLYHSLDFNYRIGPE